MGFMRFIPVVWCSCSLITGVSILLYAYTIIYLSILLLMDSVVISSFGLLKIIWTFFMSFGTHVHAFQLCIYLGMEVLAYKLCTSGEWQSTMCPRHPCMSLLSVSNSKPHSFLILSSSCSWNRSQPPQWLLASQGKQVECLVFCLLQSESWALCSSDIANLSCEWLPSRPLLWPSGFGRQRN